MQRNKIYHGDCLERMAMWPDFSIDRVITDPPYALGSEVIIQENGKPDYRRAQDFMNKWEMPTGEFWEDWFEEAMRILKHGGYLVMFGMDRQQFLFEYYAKLAGFNICQSLYWYYTSNMPKGADLSKAIDKKLGVTGHEYRGFQHCGDDGRRGGLKKIGLDHGRDYGYQSPPPVSDIAKKYNGYKYGVAPLKQTCETIMVFQKPFLTGSCRDDMFAMESNPDITCGAMNVGECYVPTAENLKSFHNVKVIWNKSKSENGKILTGGDNGRYPAQTFIDSGAGEILDGQSGIVTSGTDKGGPRNKTKIHVDILSGTNYRPPHGGDSGGCSRILHVCDYDEGDYDIMNYFSKVSPGEREDCDHPTMKPKKLIAWLVRLFKTPGCIILDPFAGSGTLGESCINLGVDYIMIEKKKEYFELACERMKYQNRSLF